MRPPIVAVVVLLAFAAGWMLRGCASEREPRSDEAPPIQAITAPSTANPPQPRTRTVVPALEDGPTSPARKSESASAPPSSPQDEAQPVAATAPPTDDKDFRKVTGIVVDSLTHEPVAHVRILLGPAGGGWHGSGSAEDGTFDVDLEPDWHAATDRLEIRAGRDGYRAARVPVTTPQVRIEIEKFKVPPKPGRIVGIARGEDGRPLTGRICVCIRDDIDLHSPGIWTNADANGRFVLEGIAPGHWTAELAESTSSVDVSVPEDGETPIELRAKFDRTPTGIFAPGELSQAAYDAEYKRMSDVVNVALPRTGDPADAFDDSIAREAMWRRQQLEYRWQRVAPGRDVEVSSAAGSVRLERVEGACYEWRARVADGVARFPSIPFGKWRAVLVRPGEPDVSVDVDVVKGEGALTVEIPAAK